MRKIFLMVVLILTLGVGQAFAVEATGAGVREKAQERVTTVQQKVEERKAQIMERVELQKEKIASKAQEIRRRLTERRKTAIKLHFSRMYRRMNAATARLNTIANRIESRLMKMEDRGIDVTKLQTDLSSAKEDIELTKGLLSDLDEQADDVVNADDPKTAFETVKNMVREVVMLIKSVHQQLVAIITEMKGINTPAPEATESANI